MNAAVFALYAFSNSARTSDAIDVVSVRLD
jgi:hypothetical protein